MGHAHGPAAHAAGRHRGALLLAWGLTTAFFLVELAAGLATGSLALLSDAGHMGADVIVLSAALLATTYATRADRSGRKTFGSYRVEVLAAALSCLVMLVVGFGSLVVAASRFGSPVDVPAAPMLVVGVLGLAVNAAAMLALRRGAADSLNVRGAYLEVIADAAGSVGVIVAAILVATTGDGRWDTAVAVAIGCFMLIRAAGLARSVWAVLGQHVPHGVDAAAVEADLAGLPDVDGVHDLHLWTLTSGMDVATVHLSAVDGADAHRLLHEARAVLRDRHQLEHATVQIESCDRNGCAELRW